MAVIKAEDAEDVVRAAFGSPAPEPEPATTPAFPRVDADGEPVEKTSPPEPEAAPEPEAPPEPPPQPVFEVPPDILQGFYDQAIQQGLEDGKNQVFAELTVLQERYAAALDQLVAASEKLEANNQVQLITLACRVAERLVRAHLQVNPEHLMNLIREALEESDDRDEVVVHCSPMDFEFLTERRDDLAAGAGEAFKVQVVADHELEYGDFRIESRVGTVDGRVASRMHTVREALTGDEVDDVQG